MNPLLVASLVGALLAPVPPISSSTSGRPPGGDRVSAADGRLDPSQPRAVWPLEPRPEVVAGFLAPLSTWSAGHRGVDLLGFAGAPVRAALGGRVSFAGELAGRGVLVIDHGDYRTTYEPVRATVRRGDSVATGGPIGTLQTGRSHCAPRFCLHWGLISGSTYQDPLSLLRRTAVRLLPLEPQARG